MWLLGWCDNGFHYHRSNEQMHDLLWGWDVNASKRFIAFHVCCWSVFPMWKWRRWKQSLTWAEEVNKADGVITLILEFFLTPFSWRWRIYIFYKSYNSLILALTKISIEYAGRFRGNSVYLRNLFFSSGLKPICCTRLLIQNFIKCKFFLCHRKFYANDADIKRDINKKWKKNSILSR